MSAASLDPRDISFYARPVVEVARELVGCVLAHEGTSGRIVETEAYHEEEEACHAYVGLTGRTKPLFGPPGVAYVYRSYGIHALVNAVCEDEGTGAAVLIRALEPLDNVDLMRERRGLERDTEPVLRAGQAHAGARHRARAEPELPARRPDRGASAGRRRAAATTGGRSPDRDHPRRGAPVALLRCRGRALHSQPRPPELRRQRRAAAA